MTWTDALALLLLWAVAVDVLIIALIFWYGRRAVELSERLNNLRGLLEAERAERTEQRKQLQRFGASMHELIEMLEMLFGPEPVEVEDTRQGAKPEPHREEPLEEHPTTAQSQQDRKAALEGPLARRLAKTGRRRD